MVLALFPDVRRLAFARIVFGRSVNHPRIPTPLPAARIALDGDDPREVDDVAAMVPLEPGRQAPQHRSETAQCEQAAAV